MKKPNVLIIDDSCDILNVLEEFFDHLGFDVYVAPSGERGLDLVRVHEFMVVLLDIFMPDMDGVSVLSKLKDMCPTVPVVMITGYNDDVKAMQCMTLGAYDYIKKPFDYDYLRTSVLSLLLTS